jgi:RNA polymerase II subunit A small phosphatase-like protein
MSRGLEEKLQINQDSSNTLIADDHSSPAKSRSLLNVPSRSSSQRNSPTSTGLSGVTASDPRDSIGGHSKESKGSMLGRHRNGSASSNQLGMGTGPTNTPGNSQPSSPAAAAHKKKKAGGGGFLSIFGCCGVPDTANGIDSAEEPLPTHKVEKIPHRPTTASRRPVTPSEQPSSSKTQLYEKEQPPTQSIQDSSRNTKRISGSSTQDQSTVGDRDGESKQTTLAGNSNPAISVEPPLASSSHADAVNSGVKDSSAKTDADGDVAMADSEAEPVPTKRIVTQASEDSYPPPPPAGPVPVAPSVPLNPIIESSSVVASEQQKFLLPPQQPEFRGKKCLVLDLDETLVHSSFKVREFPYSRRHWHC